MHSSLSTQAPTHSLYLNTLAVYPHSLSYFLYFSIHPLPLQTFTLSKLYFSSTTPAFIFSSNPPPIQPSHSPFYPRSSYFIYLSSIYKALLFSTPVSCLPVLIYLLSYLQSVPTTSSNPPIPIFFTPSPPFSTSSMLPTSP